MEPGDVRLQAFVEDKSASTDLADKRARHAVQQGVFDEVGLLPEAARAHVARKRALVRVAARVLAQLRGAVEEFEAVGAGEHGAGPLPHPVDSQAVASVR